MESKESPQQAADADTQTVIKCPNDNSATGDTDDSQPGSHNQAETQDEEMVKLQSILKKLKCSEFENCVQVVDDLMKKPQILHSDVLHLLTAFVDRLPEKEESKPATNPSSSWWDLMYPYKVRVHTVVTGQTFGAHETMLENLKGTWTMVEMTSLAECDIIIVFCPITSRTGSDVEAVKRQAAVFSNDKPVVVVLMYHIRDEEFSPGGRKWFEDPRCVLEVHVLFHETQRGLLQCAQNDQAVREIQGELYRCSKSRWCPL
ncbi:uncharacterized protein LOC114426655 isoform X2 [Parambassis ranga]|uniref:Uncharacterized protein LOC114426655 isoform X2 n=1 Tax=Parambassis ranga TaxID=210632 RepID=A0A6P7HE28_9TELE|nr:uncharacterized protein LOC114426655 isoform X2 [Parambassis ranga]